MANKPETCSASCCPWGWLGKKFLGLSLGLWFLVFAILPHTVQGLSWTANMIAGAWRPSDRVVVVEPVEMRPVRASAEMADPRGVRRGTTRSVNTPSAE